MFVGGSTPPEEPTLSLIKAFEIVAHVKSPPLREDVKDTTRKNLEGTLQAAFSSVTLGFLVRPLARSAAYVLCAFSLARSPVSFSGQRQLRRQRRRHQAVIRWLEGGAVGWWDVRM